MMLTQEQEFPAVPIELLQVDAELMDRSPVAVLVQEHRELLDLLGREFGSELRRSTAQMLLGFKEEEMMGSLGKAFICFIAIS